MRKSKTLIQSACKNAFLIFLFLSCRKFLHIIIWKTNYDHRISIGVDLLVGNAVLFENSGDRYSNYFFVSLFFLVFSVERFDLNQQCWCLAAQPVPTTSNLFKLQNFIKQTHFVFCTPCAGCSIIRLTRTGQYSLRVECFAWHCQVGKHLNYGWWLKFEAHFLSGLPGVRELPIRQCRNQKRFSARESSWQSAISIACFLSIFWWDERLARHSNLLAVFSAKTVLKRTSRILYNRQQCRFEISICKTDCVLHNQLAYGIQLL